MYMYERASTLHVHGRKYQIMKKEGGKIVQAMLSTTIWTVLEVREVQKRTRRTTRTTNVIIIYVHVHVNNF